MLAPQWYGCLPILAACDAGKAIYCAFSMELDLDQARQVKERVENAPAWPLWPNSLADKPATLRLKELIATRLVAPRLLFCHTRVPVEHGNSGAGRTAGAWLAHQRPDRSVDWCTYVVGRCRPRCWACVTRRLREGLEDDYQMMSLDFSGPGDPGSGATAQISCGRYMQSSWHEALRLSPARRAASRL